MAKAVIATKPGGPEVLEYKEISVGNPKATEVKLKQTAIGVNFIDTYHRSGRYPGASFPNTIGVEAAGKIEEIGNNVVNFKPGDRVCYPLSIGAYTSERLVDQNILIKIPDGISDEIAAGGITKGITVYHLFNESKKINVNDWVLFHAAAGGVGLIACQWAKSIGAKLIGTVSTEEKSNLAKQNGAFETIIYTQEDFVDKVSKITTGNGVSAVYDGIGADNPSKSSKCLEPFGTLCTFGAAAGTSELTIDELPPSIKYTKGSIATLIKFPEMLKVAASNFFKLVSNGDINITIGQTYDLADAKQAHVDLESRKTTGSIILKP